jgi:hypothetical protein
MNNILIKQFEPRLFINEFTEESQKIIQEYSCSLCEGILSNAVIDRCGHSFCKECIENLLNNKLKCPYSKLEIFPKEIFSNSVVNSVIEKQLVFCKNKEKECKWIGKLVDRKNHIYYDCEKEDLFCEFKGCNEKISREKFLEHINNCIYRLVKCHHCSESFNFNQSDNHYKDCPGIPFECPNKCGLKIKQNEVNIHLEVFCDNTLSECPFKLVGCTYADLRKELKKHLNDFLEPHLKLINNKIHGLQEQINKQKDDIHNLKKENKVLKNETDENKNLILKSNNDLVSSINFLTKNLENFKLYSQIPQSNFIPNFFNKDLSINTNNVFQINSESYSISKISNNHGWYGISSEPIELGNEKIIMNMKILNSISSCIMFGITFSNQKCPLTGGFYQQTKSCDASYMFYCYNLSVYFKGRSQEYSNGSCVENDIITLIIDPINKCIFFRKNGVLISDNILVDFFKQDDFDTKGIVRVALDFCDSTDEIIFLS